MLGHQDPLCVCPKAIDEPLSEKQGPPCLCLFCCSRSRVSLRKMIAWSTWCSGITSAVLGSKSQYVLSCHNLELSSFLILGNASLKLVLLRCQKRSWDLALFFLFLLFFFFFLLPSPEAGTCRRMWRRKSWQTHRSGPFSLQACFSVMKRLPVVEGSSKAHLCFVPRKFGVKSLLCNLRKLKEN